MLIDYSKIQANADLRKVRLSNLEKLLVDAQRYAAMAEEVSTYVLALRTALKLLDLEGQAMLPPEIHSIISNSEMMIHACPLVRSDYPSLTRLVSLLEPKP